MRYIIINKPFGVLSQFTSDAGGHATLKAFIDVPAVYAAGRLDHDSEGLLLLTDDGALIARLTRPAHQIQKCYYVMVEGEANERALEKLRRGIDLKGIRTRPADVRQIPDPPLPPRPKPLTPHGPTFWLEVKLREGRKRQIRHMTAAVGLFTLRIVRFAIGPLRLGDLGVGKWRDLTERELAQLR